MSAEVCALGPLTPADGDAMARRALLAAWKERLTTGCLALVAAAFVVGRARAWVGKQIE